MNKDYKLEIAFNQSTTGSADGETLITEYTDDQAVHLAKTKVFTKHLTTAVNAITQELCDMGLEALARQVGGKPKP